MTSEPSNARELVRDVAPLRARLSRGVRPDAACSHGDLSADHGGKVTSLLLSVYRLRATTPDPFTLRRSSSFRWASFPTRGIKFSGVSLYSQFVS